MAFSLMNDKRLPTERLAVVSYVIVGVIALLLFGFWKLQIIDSDRYAQMAERNRVRSIPIIAPRGSMLDREGRVLVDNYPSFSVLLLRDAPEQVEKLLAADCRRPGHDAGRREAADRGYRGPCRNSSPL